MSLPALIQRLLRRPAVSEAGDDTGGPATAPPAPGDPVAAARTQARRRLLGAAVLLLVAVLVFSFVFESRPRPLPLDTPIELAGRPPVSASGAVGAVRPVTPLATAPAASMPAASAQESRPVPVEPVETEVPPAAPVASGPAPATATAAAGSKAPPAVPATAPAAQPPASQAAAEQARFVVQVGAFADAAQVRQLRARLDKLGLRKHYVQAIEAKDGQRVNRVRLGPWASREEAERAAARLKEAGLPGQVLEL
jgi:DedD protein